MLKNQNFYWLNHIRVLCNSSLCLSYTHAQQSVTMVNYLRKGKGKAMLLCQHHVTVLCECTKCLPFCFSPSNNYIMWNVNGSAALQGRVELILQLFIRLLNLQKVGMLNQCVHQCSQLSLQCNRAYLFRRPFYLVKAKCFPAQADFSNIFLFRFKHIYYSTCTSFSSKLIYLSYYYYLYNLCSMLARAHNGNYFITFLVLVMNIELQFNTTFYCVTAFIKTLPFIVILTVWSCCIFAL